MNKKQLLSEMKAKRHNTGYFLVGFFCFMWLGKNKQMPMIFFFAECKQDQKIIS